MVESWIVIPVVVGSNPIGHPILPLRTESLSVGLHARETETYALPAISAA
jgi:hypothetical protein